MSQLCSEGTVCYPRKIATVRNLCHVLSLHCAPHLLIALPSPSSQKASWSLYSRLSRFVPQKTSGRESTSISVCCCSEAASRFERNSSKNSVGVSSGFHHHRRLLPAAFGTHSIFPPPNVPTQTVGSTLPVAVWCRSQPHVLRQHPDYVRPSVEEALSQTSLMSLARMHQTTR